MERLAAVIRANRMDNAGWMMASSRIASAQRMCMANDVNSGSRVVGHCVEMVGNVRETDSVDVIAPMDGVDISVRLVSRIFGLIDLIQIGNCWKLKESCIQGYL